MPKITTYEPAPSTFRAAPEGTAAWEQAGRRVGPMYRQAAEDMVKEGRLKADTLKESLWPWNILALEEARGREGTRVRFGKGGVGNDSIRYTNTPDETTPRMRAHNQINQGGAAGMAPLLDNLIGNSPGRDQADALQTGRLIDVSAGGGGIQGGGGQLVVPDQNAGGVWAPGQKKGVWDWMPYGPQGTAVHDNSEGLDPGDWRMVKGYTPSGSPNPAAGIAPGGIASPPYPDVTNGALSPQYPGDTGGIPYYTAPGGGLGGLSANPPSEGIDTSTGPEGSYSYGAADSSIFSRVTNFLGSLFGSSDVNYNPTDVSSEM